MYTGDGALAGAVLTSAGLPAGQSSSPNHDDVYMIVSSGRRACLRLRQFKIRHPRIELIECCAGPVPKQHGDTGND
jgi:hypothetical protein